jgi:hypothetical protein
LKHDDILPKLPTKAHLEAILRDMVNESDKASLIEAWEAHYGDNTKPKQKVNEDEGEVYLTRARNKDGHFVRDDPNTPENEAWVKTKKKKKG